MNASRKPHYSVGLLDQPHGACQKTGTVLLQTTTLRIIRIVRMARWRSTPLEDHETRLSASLKATRRACREPQLAGPAAQLSSFRSSVLLLPSRKGISKAQNWNKRPGPAAFEPLSGDNQIADRRIPGNLDFIGAKPNSVLRTYESRARRLASDPQTQPPLQCLPTVRTMAIQTHLDHQSARHAGI